MNFSFFPQPVPLHMLLGRMTLLFWLMPIRESTVVVTICLEIRAMILTSSVRGTFHPMVILSSPLTASGSSQTHTLTVGGFNI